MIKRDVGSKAKVSGMPAKRYAKRIAEATVVALSVSMSGVACSQAPEVPQAQSVPQASLQARIAEVVAKTRKNLVFVKGGSFEMGDFGVKYSVDGLPYTANTDDDYLHKVTLSSFSISAYKVTYAEYDVFSDATGRPRITTHPKEQATRLPDAPAGVNWQQAHDYCQWIGQQLGVPMSLPTEAQWEYAARDRGKLVVYATNNGKVEEGRNVASYDQMETYAHKLGSIAVAVPMSVGLYPPTPMGLYDIVSNGHEWVADWYAPNAYQHSANHDPIGPAHGVEKAMRGCGNGDSPSDVCMTFIRGHASPVTQPDEFDGHPTGRNSDLDHTARCIASTPAPVPKE